MKLLSGSDPVSESVEMHHCECEHGKHFGDFSGAHPFGEPVLRAALKEVWTMYGPYRVCLACVRQGCLSGAA